jgi:dual specificity MAP kinase phosphatase
VKYGGNLTKSRIKGAVAPDEILSKSAFIDADPQEGFSVRNFHIQVAKLAPLSDIVVYGEDGIKGADLLSLALEISNAQKEWRMRFDPGQETPLFNTFALSGMLSPRTAAAVADGSQLTGS